MQRRAVILLLASVALLGCSKKSDEGGGEADHLKPLTVEEVSTRLTTKDGKTFIFDNNSPETYAKGHVPGAKWLDDEKVTADALPADKAATLIFYCHSET
jgi:hypothetical protein